MHPNFYLNHAIAYYERRAMIEAGGKLKGKFAESSPKYFQRINLSPNIKLELLGEINDFWFETAILQRELVLSGSPNTSFRSVVRNRKHLLPFVGIGPQSWLILSYIKTLKSIAKLDSGEMVYGPKKDVYRHITDNVKAARMMFEEASRRIAAKKVEIYGHIGNQIALIEGGAGNGAATLTTLKAFNGVGVYPAFWLTDIDVETYGVAETLFRQNGFKGNHFPWSPLDIGDKTAVNSLLNSFSGWKKIFNINFIIHETEPLADIFLKAISQSPDTDLVISEFFLPEDEYAAGPDFPWWFVRLHELSGQYLRTESEFMKFPQKYGYKLFDRVDHQVHNGVPVTSTLFFRKK